MQKKRDSFTCSFLAFTYWFHLNLIIIFRKFRLFPNKTILLFFCAIHNEQMDEISKFHVKKKCHRNNILMFSRLKTHLKDKHLIELVKMTKH